MKIHNEIYKSSKVTFIGHLDNPDVITLSMLNKTMHPVLDDYAQLTGINTKCETWDISNSDKNSKLIALALKGRNAVLINKYGALCTGNSLSDLAAIDLVLAKECESQIGMSLFKKGNPLSIVDCFLMRTIYVLKYSKQAKK